MRKGFGGPGGRDAAVFLAQALALLLTELTRENGFNADAEMSLHFQELIQKHYPLGDEATEALEEGRAEFRTRETFEVRSEVVRGAQAGTGYHLGLRTESF